MTGTEDFAGLGRNGQAGDDLVLEINRMLEEILPDAPQGALPDLLRPVIEGMALLNAPQAESFLRKIQFRFKLRREEVAAYRRMMRSKQKDAESRNNELTPTPIAAACFDGLVDVVSSDGKVVFLIQDDKGLRVERSLDLDDTRFIPPPAAKLPWLLPRAEEVLRWQRNDSDTNLYGDLLAYFRSISELPSDPHYDLLVLWVLHTYVLEWARYSPILWLYGVPERGKSRTGKGLIYVARRGIHVESLREAFLLRAAQDLKATLFIDVMDLSRKLERSGSEDILLQRFERGVLVPRVLYPEKGAHQDTVFYNVFGPTVIGTNDAIHHILETRSIRITLPYARRSFENEVTPEGAWVLRERLTAFRARKLGSEPSSVKKPAQGRLGDILKPLLQIATVVCPERLPIIMNFFRELQSARLIQKIDSLEAQILLAVQASAGIVVDGVLPVGAVADQLNRSRSEKEKITNHKVANRLAALGFEKTRERSSNYAAIFWDPERLARVMTSYGLPGTPETPETPEARTRNDLDAGVSVASTAPDSGVPGDPHSKLRPASGWKSEGSEIAGVSGVARRFSPTPPTTRSRGTRISVDSYEIEERAAILEFDGELSQAEAETGAKAWRDGDGQ